MPHGRWRFIHVDIFKFVQNGWKGIQNAFKNWIPQNVPKLARDKFQFSLFNRFKLSKMDGVNLVITV
jgi:hypothetical protein